MKKRILSIFLLLLLLCGCQAAGEASGTTGETQPEPMQALWVMSYRENEDGSGRMAYSYDSRGRLTRYESSGPVTYYLYDDGTLADSAEALDKEHATPEARAELEQTIRERLGNPSEESIAFVIVHLDADGTPVRQVRLTGDMNLEFVTHYTYDDRGNCVKELTYYADHVEEVNGTYDENNNQILRKSYDSKTNVTTVSEREFDASGNMLTRSKEQYTGIYEEVAERENVGYWEYTYTADGRRDTEVEYDAAGQPKTTLSYKYDAIGNISGRTYYYHDADSAVDWRYSYTLFQVSREQAESLYMLYEDVIGFVLYSITDLTDQTGASGEAVPAGIPKNALQYEGHYYYIFNEEGIGTWEDAAEFCREQGGYLAVIGSEEENRVLHLYVQSKSLEMVFFGYSDAGHEGQWQWVEEESSAYTNWHPGQPNGGTTDNYAQFVKQFVNGDENPDGEWSDAYFGGDCGHAFLCEWPGK